MCPRDIPPRHERIVDFEHIDFGKFAEAGSSPHDEKRRSALEGRSDEVMPVECVAS
jgi:hypothetical protein